YMTRFTAPLSYDAITQATPLALLKENKMIEQISYLDLFLGNKGGCIGEVCVAALLLGGIFLLARRIISWHIPVTYIAVTGLMCFIFGGKTLFSGNWLSYILSGGLFLGAFFMATDYVTSPLTHKGQIVFGAGCGLLTAIIRLWGGYPEGVSYSILMMNAAVPLIDRYTKKRIFGTR
ncbi:MAG TPA: RnfABCDGE type electron transport complex subunit D, partial [Candidatus Omnitrophota bacterium]|nr:RnfABCDGE type electron transport complex subunit D [Candidatus Omnitrophota bacterium]